MESSNRTGQVNSLFVYTANRAQCQDLVDAYFDGFLTRSTSNLLNLAKSEVFDIALTEIINRATFPIFRLLGWTSAQKEQPRGIQKRLTAHLLARFTSALVVDLISQVTHGGMRIAGYEYGKIGNKKVVNLRPWLFLQWTLANKLNSHLRATPFHHLLTFNVALVGIGLLAHRQPQAYLDDSKIEKMVAFFGAKQKEVDSSTSAPNALLDSEVHHFEANINTFCKIETCSRSELSRLALNYPRLKTPYDTLLYTRLLRRAVQFEKIDQDKIESGSDFVHDGISILTVVFQTGRLATTIINENVQLLTHSVPNENNGIVFSV